MPLKLLYSTPVAPGDRLGHTNNFCAGPGTHIKTTDSSGDRVSVGTGWSGRQQNTVGDINNCCVSLDREPSGYICASILGYAVFLEPEPGANTLTDSCVDHDDDKDGNGPDSSRPPSDQQLNYTAAQVSRAIPQGKAILSVALPCWTAADSVASATKVAAESPQKDNSSTDNKPSIISSEKLDEHNVDSMGSSWEGNDEELPGANPFLANAKFLTASKIPTVGSKVWCQVVHVSSKLVTVDILMSCGDKSFTRSLVYSNPFRGIIRSSDIRAFRTDLVKPSECFCLGDIVVAYTISTADSRGSLLLTTVPPECGVAIARSWSGATLMPISFAFMKCPITGELEPRKVAQVAPPDQLYEL